MTEKNIDTGNNVKKGEKKEKVRVPYKRIWEQVVKEMNY